MGRTLGRGIRKILISSAITQSTATVVLQLGLYLVKGFSVYFVATVVVGGRRRKVFGQE